MAYTPPYTKEQKDKIDSFKREYSRLDEEFKLRRKINDGMNHLYSKEQNENLEQSRKLLEEFERGV